MKELQAQQASYQKDAGKLRGGMAAAATAVEAVRSSRHGLMEAAMLEQVRGVIWSVIVVWQQLSGWRNGNASQARPHGGGNARTGVRCVVPCLVIKCLVN
jgi:hypothetical protein